MPSTEIISTEDGWIRTERNAAFHEQKATHVSGNIWEFQFIDAGTFRVYDSDGNLLLRANGVFKASEQWDTLGDSQPGAVPVPDTFEVIANNGPSFTDEEFCAAVEAQVCAYALPVSDACNARLVPPPPHVARLLGDRQRPGQNLTVAQRPVPATSFPNANLILVHGVLPLWMTGHRQHRMTRRHRPAKPPAGHGLDGTSVNGASAGKSAHREPKNDPDNVGNWIRSRHTTASVYPALPAFPPSLAV